MRVAGGLLVSLATAASATESVGVLPVIGPEPLAREASESLVRRLRGIEGLAVVSFLDLERTFGAEAAAKVRACTDDACLASSLPARVDRLVAGELTADPRPRLKARLLDQAGTALVRASVAIDSVDSATAELAASLFEGRAAFGFLIVEGSPGSASIRIDGDVAGAPPVGPLSLSPGAHEVEVSAPEHVTERFWAEVRLGETTRVEVSLHEPVGVLPFALAGGGAAALVGGLALRAVAAGIASDWETACADGSCAPGYTRARHDGDSSTVTALSVAAVALVVAGATAIVGGGTAWIAR